MSHHIPVYARFQWLNHPLVAKLVRPFFRYQGRGRRGYDKVDLFLWLCYHQLMGCSYRDLESMTGIDYSTFIKFRGRLKRTLPSLLGKGGKGEEKVSGTFFRSTAGTNGYSKVEFFNHSIFPSL